MNENASSNSNVFAQLMAVIEDRKVNPTARSYTNSLLQEGAAKIGAKIIEEANEVVEAGMEPADTRQQHVVLEAADLVYHLFVLLGYCDIPLVQLEDELKRRFGVSGLDEKASRGQKGAGDD